MSVSAAREHTHQHVVGIYEDDRDLVAAITDFLGDAFSQNGAAIVVATPAHRAAIDEALTLAGFSPEALSQAGIYAALDAAETLDNFMSDGRPDGDRLASNVGGVIDDAAARDGPIRLFGEMVALLWDEGNLEGALALEGMWNDLAAKHAFALLCAYTMSSLEASGDLVAAKRMCDRHDSVIPLSSSPFLGASVATHAGCDHYDRVFVATPTSLRDVRQFTRDALATWTDPASVDNGEIIASELATNAVTHARSPFRVSLSRSADTITIAVRDTSFSSPRHVTPTGNLVGGRGVHLVASIARDWGTRPESDGKTVWAELGPAAGA